MTKTINLSMQETQRVSFEILKTVTAICESQNLRYFLMYGTLIGAVRHNGYIPWDDDVDIMMPRPDYERFLDYAKKHGNKLGIYRVINRNLNNKYIYTITRVYDPGYEIIKEDEKNCGMGIFIDIYPYDGLGNNRRLALHKLQLTRKYCNIIVQITRTKFTIPEKLNIKGKISYFIKYLIHRMNGVDFYHNKLNSLREGSNYEDSEYVGPLMWFFTEPEKILFNKSIFDETTKINFEGQDFFAPKDYHKLLSQEYGDYMQLPPVEKRVYHHQYKAYKKD